MDVNALLVYQNQAKRTTLSQGTTEDVLRQEFSKLFPGQTNDFKVLQIWNEEWSHWIDLTDEDIQLSSNRCKFRLIGVKNTHPLGNLAADSCAFLCCDMQERFKPAIKYFDEIATVANRLLQGANILDIPVIVTEQYPKGLLHTVKELDISQAKAVVPKTLFSMMVPDVENKLKECVPNLKSVVLFGVEAHVCIQQTALDCLSRGVEVHVIADACSSRSQVDRLLAYDRLRRCGAIITTAETVLLQLVKDKDHPKFKEVQSIIKVLPPDTGILNIQSNI